MKRVLLIIIFHLISSNFSYSQNRMIIQIRGIESDQGEIFIALHNNANSFPKKADLAVDKTRAKIKDGIAFVEFNDLEFGYYAISCFHDKNNNGKMDYNWLGIPKEGFGFSRNVEVKMSPPKFDDAKIKFTKDKQTVKIKLQYIK